MVAYYQIAGKQVGSHVVRYTSRCPRMSRIPSCSAYPAPPGGKTLHHRHCTTTYLIPEMIANQSSWPWPPSAVSSEARSWPPAAAASSPRARMPSRGRRLPQARRMRRSSSSMFLVSGYILCHVKDAMLIRSCRDFLNAAGGSGEKSTQ